MVKDEAHWQAQEESLFKLSLRLAVISAIHLANLAVFAMAVTSLTIAGAPEFLANLKGIGLKRGPVASH
jgi:hypothetical protein